MGSFMGGSAPAMARQIADGYTLMTPAVLKRLTTDQIQNLEFELDKRLRETRSEPIDLEDQPSITTRNRRLQRIEGSLRVLRGVMMQRRRKGI